MPFVVVSVVALVFGFVGSLPMAGPIAILVVSNAANEHYAEARRTAYGAAIAEGLYAFLAFWGFATFLARHDAVLPISHGVTGAVLLGLGIHFCTFKLKDDDSKKSDDGAKKKGPFLVGFSIAAINPTLLVTWSAVTTFLYSRQIVQMTGTLAIPFGACAALGITLWAVFIVWLLRRFRDHFPKSVLTWVVRVMGGVLIALAAWSFVELVRWIVDPASRPKKMASQSEIAAPRDPFLAPLALNSAMYARSPYYGPVSPRRPSADMPPFWRPVSYAEAKAWLDSHGGYHVITTHKDEVLVAVGVHGRYGDAVAPSGAEADVEDAFLRAVRSAVSRL
jgi:threonine/homoserine/homoserine lactone efflux protein